MKRILVGIQRVVDYNVRVSVKPDTSGVATDGLKMSINPLCWIAMLTALWGRPQATFASKLELAA